MFKDIIITVVTLFAMATISVIVKMVVDYINNEIDVKQQSITNEKINSLIDKVQDIVSDVVLSLNQTTVDVLKKEKKFDSEAKAKVKEEARNTISNYLNGEMVDAVIQNYGDLEGYIDMLIESTLYYTKKEVD